MATENSTVEFILSKLGALGDVNARKMFGEYALYYKAKVVALICDDTLFVKITDKGKSFVGDYYQEGEAYPKAKPSMVIDEDRINDVDWICELIEITYSELVHSVSAT